MSDGHDDLPEQMRIRREKLDRLRERGVEPYPLGFPRTTTIAAVRERHTGLEPGVSTGTRAGVVGRVLLARNTGKLCFATIRDGSGDIQIMLSLANVGAEALESWKRDVDLGDHVGVEGEVITSRRGELSIMADRFAITSKCLRPLPEKHAGLTDPEQRVRLRYVDLIVNPESHEMVRARAAVLRSVRETLDRHGYVEVETPILQPIHGGAAARPFETHLNAFDLPTYLRIAIELHLKRLLVGGVERVYEIGRIFRNEGVDSTHSPEFTMLEAYEAYGDYDSMAELTRAVVLDAARAMGRTTVAGQDGAEIDLEAPWRTVSVHQAVSDTLGEQVTPDTSADDLRKIADRHEVALQPGWDAGHIVLELFEKLVEHTLIQPTFVRDYPAAVRPLAPPPPPPPPPRRGRAGARLLRAERPGRAAAAAHRAVAARRRGRPRGDAAGRGLPARPGVRDAPGRRRRDRDRPADHAADRPEHPGDDPVPDGQAGVNRAVPGRVSRAAPGPAR